MGSSADAKIIYGFPFEGEDFEYDNALYHEDPEIWLAHHQGLVEPEGSYDDNEEADIAHSAYWKARAGLPLDIAWDGDAMGDCMTAYLVIKEATLRGDWGGPTKIPPGHFNSVSQSATYNPLAEWNELLRQFCEKAGLTCEVCIEPNWLLIVSYG